MDSWKLIVANVAPLIVAAGAITIPNAVHAYGQSQQKHTLAEIRAVSDAWEAYASHHGGYDVDRVRSASEASPSPAAEGVDWQTLHPVQYVDLQTALVPTYIRYLPKNDAWGGPLEFATFDYVASPAGEQVARQCAIRTLGKGHSEDRPRYRPACCAGLDCDLVSIGDDLLVFPEGMCK